MNLWVASVGCDPGHVESPGYEPQSPASSAAVILRALKATGVTRNASTQTSTLMLHKNRQVLKTKKENKYILWNKFYIRFCKTSYK